MTHVAAALFFIVALLAAAVAIHMTVRIYWAEIVLALKGELGLEPRAASGVRAWQSGQRGAAAS